MPRDLKEILDVLAGPLGALVRAVPIPVGGLLLGNKSRSEMYKLAGDGFLDFVKDGTRTLVTLDSIASYNASLKRAEIKPYHRGVGAGDPTAGKFKKRASKRSAAA
jgi:hypothetical protein